MPAIDDYLEFRKPLLPARDELMRVAAANAAAYRSAEPYPHVVLDGLFADTVLDRVVQEFPDPRGIRWRQFDNDKEVKLASRDEAQIPPFILYLIYALNGATFLAFLEHLTGIGNLIADPYLEGGGLHQIQRGGRLGVHADFNKHTRLGLDRRLNLLLYLNKDWNEEWGGALELWDRDMTRPVHKIQPVFNRVVVFSTTDHSMHGHPDALQCPPDRSRQSIALYYYTNGRPEEEESTTHSTLFRPRPQERFGLTPRQRLRRLLPKPLRRWMRP